MPKSLEIIKQLEKKIGKEIKQLNLADMIGTTRGYALDENEEIIGLNFYALKKNVADFFIHDLKNLTVLDLTGNHLRRK